MKIQHRIFASFNQFDLQGLIESSHSMILRNVLLPTARQNESHTLTDVVNGVASMGVARSESVAATDSPSATAVMSRALAESVAATDTIDRTVVSDRSVAESVASSESADSTVLSERSASETAVATDDIDATVTSSLDESIVGADSISAILTASSDLSESSAGTESVSANLSTAQDLAESVAATASADGSIAVTGHRYWRMINFVVGSSLLEISEVRIFEGGTAADSGVSIVAQTAPNFGSISVLQDGSLSTRCYWDEVVVENVAFYLKWDLGSGVTKFIDGVKIGAYDQSNRYLTGFAWQWSDDDSSWTTQSTKSGLTYPGNLTLSALIDVSS